MALTVESALTTKKKELHTAPAVKQKRVILSGVNVDYSFVLRIVKLNTVDYAKSSLVNRLWINMIQSMDRKVLSKEPDFWHIERKLETRNTLR